MEDENVYVENSKVWPSYTLPFLWNPLIIERNTLPSISLPDPYSIQIHIDIAFIVSTCMSLLHIYSLTY